MTKDEWIQRAKALLFDLTFATSGSLRREINELIKQGGGYDEYTEDCESELRWEDEE